MNFRCWVFTITMLFIVSCSNEKQSNLSEESSMNPLADGAFLLSKVTITEKGETYQLQRDQIKIYSNGKFMFAFDNESTGDMDVGAGNATWINGVMVEEPLVNHDGPLSDLSFDITIEPTEKGFNQVLHGMKYDDGRVLETMVEEWHRAPGIATQFAGLRRLESREAENPDLTEFAETKMIGGGYFIVLQSALYQGQKIRNFGFGSFNLQEDGSVLEAGMTGSWDNYSEWSAEVRFETIDDNHIKRFFSIGGREVVQSYERM